MLVLAQSLALVALLFKILRFHSLNLYPIDNGRSILKITTTAFAVM